MIAPLASMKPPANEAKSNFRVEPSGVGVGSGASVVDSDAGSVVGSVGLSVTVVGGSVVEASVVDDPLFFSSRFPSLSENTS